MASSEFVCVVEEIGEVVQFVKDRLSGGGIVLLRGDLSAGKTTFVKEFAKSFDLFDVSSPTFSVMNVYGDDIFHYDIYNHGSDKFFELGLQENLEVKGYHFIEWADESIEKMLESYGLSFMSIQITPTKNKRVYKCTY